MQKFTLTTTAIALAAFFTTGAAWAEGSDSKPGSKSTPAQIFSIDSVLYGCVPGSQAKGPDLKKCTKLPSNVVDLIKAAGTKIPTLSTTAPTTPPSTTTTATTTGSKPDDDSPDVTVVGTPQGPKSCPVSAFTSDKLLDLTQC